MSTFWLLVYYALTVFLLLLVARVVFDLVLAFSRTWRPSGASAAALEMLYTATDPPLRALRRVLPPVRLGGIAIDLAFLLLFVIVQVLRSIAASLAS